jgi:hypothetical protein
MPVVTNIPVRRGPRGLQGPGFGFNFRGSRPDYASLPSTGNTVGDAWATTDDGKIYVWDGTDWVDVSPISGPEGAPGSPGLRGPPGLPGIDGAPGIPAYTFSTTAFTVPAIGDSITVDVQEPSWMTLGEWVWIEGADDGTYAGQMQITAISGNTVTLLNPIAGVASMGPQGPPGIRGSFWFAGHGPPVGTTGVRDHDFYMDVGSGNVWEFRGGAWVPI